MPSSLALAKQLTVEQHQGLLERQRVPDLHLAVGPLQHAGTGGSIPVNHVDAAWDPTHLRKRMKAAACSIPLNIPSLVRSDALCMNVCRLQFGEVNAKQAEHSPNKFSPVVVPSLAKEEWKDEHNNLSAIK